MRLAAGALLLMISPATAAVVEEPGRYLCTSHEGWAYFFEVHELLETAAIVSRGHHDVIAGWEVSCRSNAIPVFDYCRDWERLEDDAVSEPHDRLRRDCNG